MARLGTATRHWRSARRPRCERDRKACMVSDKRLFHTEFLAVGAAGDDQSDSTEAV